MSAKCFAVREEESGDRDTVRTVNQTAFDGDAEADLVERLHAGGDALFGLVAVEDDRIAGHILFSRLPIETTHGTIAAAALAPLAVLPERQGNGIGTALVRAGLARCLERGVPSVIVLGNPAYYARFGFRAETAREVQTPWPGPYLMAVELIPAGLGNGKGIAHYPAAFPELSAE